jgi:thioredoxin reductase
VRGAKIRARLVLLATGRHDDLPAVPGFAKFYGRGLYHCPYCDGWEHRGQRLVIYDPKCAGLELVEVLRTWSQDLVLCTDGSKPTPQALRLRVPIVTEKIVRAEGGRNRPLSRLRLVGGSALQCDAVFFSSNCVQKSKLPVALGCTLDASGSVVCRTHAAKGVPGLFVAGNVRGGVHLAITAAAEGAEAALAMNEWLLDADRPSRNARTP